jgi:hypothetical protein
VVNWHSQWPTRDAGLPVRQRVDGEVEVGFVLVEVAGDLA